MATLLFPDFPFPFVADLKNNCWYVSIRKPFDSDMHFSTLMWVYLNCLRHVFVCPFPNRPYTCTCFSECLPLLRIIYSILQWRPSYRHFSNYRENILLIRPELFESSFSFEKENQPRLDAWKLNAPGWKIKWRIHISFTCIIANSSIQLTVWLGFLILPLKQTDKQTNRQTYQIDLLICTGFLQLYWSW